MTEIEEMELVIETIGKMEIKSSIKSNIMKHVSSMIKKKEIRNLTKIEGIEPIQLHKNSKSTISIVDQTLKNAIKEYETCKKAIKVLDEQRSDILHYIELNELDDMELLKLSKKLKQISEVRRIYKDHRFEIEPLMKFSSSIPSETQMELNNAISETCKRMVKVKQQKYTPRQITLSDVLEHD